MATHRPIGLVLLAILFCLWGVRCLVSALSTQGSWYQQWPGLALATLTLVTAYGLFTKQSWTLRVYVVWVGLVILLGIAVEVRDGTPGIVIIVGMALIAAVYVAIGFYLRTAFRVSDRGHR